MFSIILAICHNLCQRLFGGVRRRRQAFQVANADLRHGRNSQRAALQIADDSRLREHPNGKSINSLDLRCWPAKFTFLTQGNTHVDYKIFSA